MRSTGKPTIASRLVWLVAACVLPGALIAAILAVNHYRQEKGRFPQAALATARALAASVDRELAGVQASLLALATSPYLDSNDLRAFRTQATEALRSMDATNIVLVDAQGRQLVNTLRPFGEPIPSAAPAQVLRIFETGRPAVTNLFKGTVLQQPLVGINVPVRRDGKTVYALGAAMQPERLSALLAQQHLPSGWIGAILDASGTFVARSQGIEQYLGTQAPPPLLAAMKQASDGLLEADTVEGVPVFAAFARSHVAGWTVAIGIPREDLAGFVRRSLQLLAAATAALLAAGFALAWLIGRQVARAVRGLAAPARELALGRPVAVPELGLREADEVGRVLADTSHRLRAIAGARDEAEAELRASEDRFRRAFRTAGAPMSITREADGVLLDANDAFCALFGLAHAEVRGRGTTELGLWVDAADREEITARLNAEGRVRGHETRRRLRSGEIRHVLVNVDRMELEGTRCTLAVLQDITERKQAEQLLAAQKDVLRGIASGQPLGGSLDAVCRLAQSASDGMLCSILLLDEDGLHVRHAAAPSLPQEYMRAIDGSAIGPRAGSCGTAAFRREQVIVEDIATDPLWAEYRVFALPHGLRACWSTPILGTGGKVLGTFAMYYIRPRAPEPEHRRVIEIATQTAAIAIERRRADDELRDRAWRLMETEETERRNLNRELHDRVAANLSAAGLGLSMVRSQLPAQTPAAASARLEELEKLIAQTIRQARDLMAELSPPALVDFGLLAALDAHAEAMKVRAGLDIAVEGAGPEPRPPLAVETALFRIVQEALNNVLKHAGTHRAEVVLASHGRDLTITISDRGSGFDVAGTARKASWGLRAMRERAEAIGARLHVDSDPGKGTRVTVELRGSA